MRSQNFRIGKNGLRLVSPAMVDNLRATGASPELVEAAERAVATNDGAAARYLAEQPEEDRYRVTLEIIERLKEIDAPEKLIARYERIVER